MENEPTSRFGFNCIVNEIVICLKIPKCREL